MVFSPGLRQLVQTGTSQGCSGSQQRKHFVGKANKIGQSRFASLLRSCGGCCCYGMVWGCQGEVRGGALLHFPSSSSSHQEHSGVLQSSVSSFPLFSVLPLLVGAIHGMFHPSAMFHPVQCHLHPPHPIPTEMMLSENPLPCGAPPVQHLCPSLGAFPRAAKGLIIKNSNQIAALLLLVMPNGGHLIRPWVAAWSLDATRELGRGWGACGGMRPSKGSLRQR